MPLLAFCSAVVNRFAPLTKKSYKRENRSAAEEDYSFMGNLPLEGLKVVDIAVLFASPTISQNMGDFGAEVIKVEHPRLGDSLCTLGAAILAALPAMQARCLHHH